MLESAVVAHALEYLRVARDRARDDLAVLVEARPVEAFPSDERVAANLEERARFRVSSATRCFEEQIFFSRARDWQGWVLVASEDP